jgi:cytochrome b subunit of formate dehydrogenase
MKIETKTDPSGTVAVSGPQKIRAWMQVVVSLVLLASGILILIDPSWLPHIDSSAQKIAAGWVGAVIGYWLS